MTSKRANLWSKLRSGFSQSDRYGLVIIMAVAVLLRLVTALYLGNQVEPLPGTADQESYDMVARQVIAGRGFTVAEFWWPATPAGEPTAHWSYLYTLFLAAVYNVFGYNPVAARLIQAALAGVLMPLLTYRLGRGYFHRNVGLVAAGLSAVYIYFIYYAATLMTETFYIIAILWTLDLAGQLGRATDPTAVKTPPESKLLWLWLGLALGTAVLLRQVFLLFIPILFVWLMWRGYRYRQRTVGPMLATLLGTTAVVIMLILPWTVRNYRAFNSFVLLNTNAGFAFFWGNHPIHGQKFIPILPQRGPSYQELIPAELLSLNEAELDRALLKRGLGFIVEDPGRYAVLSFTRLEEYFKFWPSADSGPISNVARMLSFGLFLPFMLYGLIRAFRRSLFSEALVLYLFILTYAGVHVLTWTLIRYRLPIDAVLLIFAGVALVDIYTRLTRRAGTPHLTTHPCVLSRLHASIDAVIPLLSRPFAPVQTGDRDSRLTPD